MIKSIIQHPDSRLRLISKPIDFGTDQADIAQSVAADLLETFNATGNCIGLAAPQIGHAARIIVVDIMRNGIDRYLMVNPVITKASQHMQRVNDGCLSVGHGMTRMSTKRPARITVAWQDLTGKARSQKFSNLMAACIHHEIDHLNGRLFIDAPP